jgi:hypothetical protein
MKSFKFALLLVLGIFSTGYGNDPEEYMTVVSLIVICIISSRTWSPYIFVQKF